MTVTIDGFILERYYSFIYTIQEKMTNSLILDGLEARLESEESLAEQAAILVGTLCPQAEDPAGCEAGLNTWWSGIGKK